MRPSSTRLAAEIATAGVAAVGAYALICRPWHTQWGATQAEIEDTYPGDDLVPSPEQVATHAVTIRAPMEGVWPWLVQIGQNKGGFYSYAWLENLIGCHMRNADRVAPEFQRLQVGDSVWLHPEAPPLPVVVVESPTDIVMGSQPPSDAIAALQVMTGTWGLHLRRIGPLATRLITRSRWNRRPGLMSWLGMYGLFESAHFVMERKMMLTIKRLAESTVQGPSTPASSGVRAA
jgi:hypothetical protein